MYALFGYEAIVILAFLQFFSDVSLRHISDNLI